MEQKKYLDIEAIREEDIVIGENNVRTKNTDGFKVGDLISITTKIDGGNAAITIDDDRKNVVAFSRNQKLDATNTFSGFWNFAMELQNNQFAGFRDNPYWVVFGEWLGNSSRFNKIRYARDFGWVVYSIYDKERTEWLDVDTVKNFCEEYEFEYIEELYYGPFVSWEHCKTFLHSSKYGEVQEGIVVRDISELQRNIDLVKNNPDFNMEYTNSHHNWILKIVNTQFKESLVKEHKVDPNKKELREKAANLLKDVVTKNRVEKCLKKLQDEQELPKALTKEVMGLVAQKLSKAVYVDVQKEEPEVLLECGECGGKICSTLTMQIARELLQF